MAIEIQRDRSALFQQASPEQQNRISSLHDLTSGSLVTLCHVNGTAEVQRSVMRIASEVQYESEKGSYVIGQQFLPSTADGGKCVYERRIYWGDYWSPNKGSWLETPTALDILKFKLNL